MAPSRCFHQRLWLNSFNTQQAASERDRNVDEVHISSSPLKERAPLSEKELIAALEAYTAERALAAARNEAQRCHWNFRCSGTSGRHCLTRSSLRRAMARSPMRLPPCAGGSML